MDMTLKPTQYTNFMDVITTGKRIVQRIVQKDNERDMKMRVRLIALSKIRDGIIRNTKFNLLSTWECEEPKLKKMRFEK